MRLNRAPRLRAKVYAKAEGLCFYENDQADTDVARQEYARERRLLLQEAGL